MDTHKLEWFVIGAVTSFVVLTVIDRIQYVKTRNQWRMSNVEFRTEPTE